MNFEKGYGRPPPLPPSSYAPETIIFQKRNNLEFIKLFKAIKLFEISQELKTKMVDLNAMHEWQRSSALPTLKTDVLKG